MLWSPTLGPNLTYALLDPKSHLTLAAKNKAAELLVP